ncbi:MAG: DUF6368 family protein [Hellea sp.]
MAGPTASLLLKSLLDSEQMEMIEHAISMISSTSKSEGFQVETTLPIGGTIREKADAPFGIALENSGQFEDESMLEEIASLIGYRPVQDFGLFAMRNQDIDHRILGELICYFAERLDCYIDFGGAIFSLGLLPKKHRQYFDFVKTEWPDIAPYFEEMTKDIKGKIFTLGYMTANYKKWASHICDAEFMRNWLLSPHFHMVK